MSDAARRTARTVLQTAVSLALLLPTLVDASGIPATLPRVAGTLAVAGALTRVMAVPGVQALLPAWLRTEPSRTEASRTEAPRTEPPGAEPPGAAHDRD